MASTQWREISRFEVRLSIIARWQVSNLPTIPPQAQLWIPSMLNQNKKQNKTKQNKRREETVVLIFLCSISYCGYAIWAQFGGALNVEGCHLVNNTHPLLVTPPSVGTFSLKIIFIVLTPS